MAEKSATTAMPTPKATPNISSTSAASTGTAAPQSAPAGLYNNGSYHNVYNDPVRGGNGFWDNAGQWILISSLMNSGRNNVTYVYPPNAQQPAYGANSYAESPRPYTNSQPQHSSGGGWFWPITIVRLLVALIIGIYFYIEHRADREMEEEMSSRKTTGEKLPADYGHTRKVYPDQNITDDSLPSFWEQVKPGSTALLSDEESLNDNIKNGKGPVPQEYVIKSVQTIKEVRDIGKWLAFRLEGAQGELLLIAKIVDEEMALRVYYPAPDFPAGSRKSLVDKDCKWLFAPPEDENDFALCDLGITAEFAREADGKSVTYVKRDDTYEATLTEEPHRSGSEAGKEAFITEFGATTKDQNPEALVLEVASPTDRSKSFVSLYIGTNISPKEVQILRA